MHTDKKLLCNRGDKKREREREQIVKCLLSDLEHCTFCSILDNRILALGFRGDHPQMSLQTCHKCHFRRPPLRPHRSIHSVFIRSGIHLSLSLSLDYRNTRDMRSDPQGLLHRRTPRIVISARISFFQQIKPQRKEIPIQSEFPKTTSMHIFAIVIKARLRVGRKKQRLIAAERENVWRGITDDDDNDDERHYAVRACVSLCMKQETLMCVCLCSQVRLLTAKNLLVDFR